jgi:hypothetical protein
MQVKLKYKLWMLVYKRVPFNKEGKLMFEPYKGFIHDIKAIEDLEARIKDNSRKWKRGDRW